MTKTLFSPFLPRGLPKHKKKKKTIVSRLLSQDLDPVALQHNTVLSCHHTGQLISPRTSLSPRQGHILTVDPFLHMLTCSSFCLSLGSCTHFNVVFLSFRCKSIYFADMCIIQCCTGHCHAPRFSMKGNLHINV